MNLKLRRIKDSLESVRLEFSRKFPNVVKKIGNDDISDTAIWNESDSTESLMKGFVVNEFVLRKDLYECYGEIKYDGENYLGNCSVSAFDSDTGIWEEVESGYPDELKKLVGIIGKSGEDISLTVDKVEEIYRLIVGFDIEDESAISNKESEEGVTEPARAS